VGVRTRTLLAAAPPTADDFVVYLHIDFDVLDPRFFESVGYPTPGGLAPDELISLITAVGERFEVVGIGRKIRS
jgi:arginase